MSAFASAAVCANSVGYIDQALFEIIAAGLALNAAMQLQHDGAAAGRARHAIERALDQS